LGLEGFSILGRFANGSSGKSEMACLFLVGGASIFLNEHQVEKNFFNRAKKTSQPTKNFLTFHSNF
jgi:hypothetical protein